MIRSSPPLSLVLLAAGSGSRFGGWKQLEAVGPRGETLMDYAAYDARRAGFARIVCVIRREIEDAFRITVASRIGPQLPVQGVFQELSREAVIAGRHKPWGTAHAVLCAAGAIDGPFAVANADDFYGARALRDVAEFLSLPPNDETDAYAVVGFPLRDTLSETGGVNRAICHCGPDGWLTGIEEILGIKPNGNDAIHRNLNGAPAVLKGDTPVSMNLWGFPPSFMDRLRAGFEEFLARHSASHESEFRLPTYVNSLIQAGAARVRLLRGAGPWFGMTHPDDKPRASGIIKTLVARGEYPERLWE